MATVIDNLNTAYANYAQRLAEITVNPEASYSVDGESWSWTEYQSFIIDKMLALEQAIQRASGPFEKRTRATL